MTRDYVAIATQYAEDVVAGVVPACAYVQQACQRQLSDLERDGWRYRFDAERAAHICRFIEKLPHIKGELARQKQLITLEPWQVFIVTTVFGWVDENGRRRFKAVYEEVPRKNAKSTKTSGVGLYLLAADDEAGAEVYSAATTREQARIVWKDAKRMVDRTPGLRRRFGVETTEHRIDVPRSAGQFLPLSRDHGGNLDGLNIHGGLVDELHAHKTRELFDVLETGMGARYQPLLWMITTAGFNRSGICYEQRSYAIKVLSGAVDDPEYFGIIYTVDQADMEDEERLLTDPAIWQKANPNWGVSVIPADVARLARKALEVPSARNNFLTKRLNVWVNADSAWMDMVSWEKAGDSQLDIERFSGRPVWIAADLASKIDIASVAYLFEEGGHYFGFVRNYLNEEAAEEGRNSQYSGWAKSGRLILTPGNVTDYNLIEDDIRDAATAFDVTEAIFDPWQAEHMRQSLADDGLTTVELRATVANFSQAMKEFQALVLSGRFHHENCPVLNWMVSNVVCHTDAKDNIYPRKEFAENKIDGVVAMIMALNRALTSGPAEDINAFINDPIAI